MWPKAKNIQKHSKTIINLIFAVICEIITKYYIFVTVACSWFILKGLLIRQSLAHSIQKSNVAGGTYLAVLRRIMLIGVVLQANSVVEIGSIRRWRSH